MRTDKNDKAYKCAKCGRITYPKRAVCLKCGHREFKEIGFTEHAKVLTYTNIYALPWGIEGRFITIGVCQFENGVKAMGRLTSPDIKMGQKVKATWKKFREVEGEPVWGWIFEPI